MASHAVWKIWCSLQKVLELGFFVLLALVVVVVVLVGVIAFVELATTCSTGLCLAGNNCVAIVV